MKSAEEGHVGPYKLVKQLAGGIAQVHLAKSPGGRLVAVKVIDAPWVDADFRARFTQEVDAARRVSGVFTAPVIDADPHASAPWLAMAYVPGPSLAAAVANHGPLPLASVLSLAVGLAEGLAAIHRAGLIHRDLKPANIILANDGPRIIDFGVSLTLEAAIAPGTEPVAGTPLYMSPEQIQGYGIGPPSDIFSLGSVLMYSATGTTPFDAIEIMALFHQILQYQPSITEAPAPIRSIVERCLKKEPRLRPTAEQLLAELGPQYFGDGWLPTAIAAGSDASEGPLSRTLTDAEAAITMAKPERITGHAFISYVRDDSTQVDQLQRSLQAAGIPVWRDTANLWPGEDWRIEIRRAITNNTLVFIACFSRASLARSKSYQNEELTLAIEQLRLRSPDKPWLIPVRLDECDIPDRDIGGGRTLASIQCADLFGAHSDHAIARLIAGVKRILGSSPGHH